MSNLPPPLEGVVLAVADNDLLEISLGSEDGLQAGQELQVFRGSMYLGEVKAVSVKPDLSVARIMIRYDNGPIREGDRVRVLVQMEWKSLSKETPPAGRTAPRSGTSPAFQPPGAGPAEAAPAGETAAPTNPFSALRGGAQRFPLQQQMLLAHLADTRKALIDTEHAIKQANLALASAQRKGDNDASREAHAALELADRHADRVRREYETQLRLLELGIQAADAQLENAVGRFERVKELHEKGVVTQSELAAYQAEAEVARHEREYARTLFNLHREATASPAPKDEAPKETEDAPNNTGGFF